MISKSSRRRKRLSQNNSEGLLAFQYRVYCAVKKIPAGHVATYEQIARAAGTPRAARAVGNALNKNIFSDVPCHRVVRGDRTVGGYALGTVRKIKILMSEGMDVKNGRIEAPNFQS